MASGDSRGVCATVSPVVPVEACWVALRGCGTSLKFTFAMLESFCGMYPLDGLSVTLGGKGFIGGRVMLNSLSV